METAVFRSSGSIWVLLVCISVVSCEERISVSVGQDVLLPCFYSQVDKLPRTITFFWRGKDDVNVYDVLDSEPDVSSQAQHFKGRIRCFPELYSKGNFSVVLQNVQQRDGGLYDCFIPSLRFRHHVDLIVKGPTDAASASAAPSPLTNEPAPLPPAGGDKIVEPKGGSDSGDTGSIAVRLSHLSLLLFLLFGQTVLCDH